ncbi:hypothetical protein [Acidicapsa acidisoli]|uniref:hypothetical protein n=1 Tax=Acidicapsa acidisoli TaxID=1615681 RepID=UPI0021DFAE50|nr:hypothetical protein [Acidicapsa acidisoli]
MMLKSDRFASSLYDPDSLFTLRHYYQEMNLAYEDVSLPVPIETFVVEFQKRLAPTLEETDITSAHRILSIYRESV